MKIKKPTVNVAKGLFLFQAHAMPMIVPIIKLIIVESPISPRLQGIATFKTSATGVGNLDMEIPKSPFNRLKRYFPYCVIRESSVLTPKAAFMDSKASGGTPCILSTRSDAGSPGIILGKKKLMVIATKRAKSKSPTFLAKYFIFHLKLNGI